MAAEVKLCNFCCKPVATLLSDAPPSPSCDQEDLLPGSRGSRVLNEHLRAYFIMSRLLKCSKPNILKVLDLTITKKHEGAIRGDRLFSVCCGKCEKIVTKALELQCQIAELQEGINNLGKSLVRQMQGCQNKENTHVTESIAHKLKKLLHLGGENMDISSKIKVEIVPNNFPLDEDDAYFDFDDELDDCRNDVKAQLVDRQNGAPGGEKFRAIDSESEFNVFDDSESESIQSRHNEELIDFECNSDSDADYNPESACPIVEKPFPKLAKRRAARTSQLPLQNDTSASVDKNTSGEIYACKLCESVYTTIPGYRKHLRMHRQSELLGNKYDCPTCRHPTVSESNLRRHITKIHGPDPSQSPSVSKSSRPEAQSYEKSSDGNFQCKLCESVYTTLLGFQKHVGRHKESSLLGNLYDCPICRHPTISEKNLRIHLAAIHQNKISPELKDELSKKFPNMDIERLQVSDSSNVHNVEPSSETGAGAFENNDLPFTFENQCYVQSTDGNYQCLRCKSVYTTPHGMKKHELMHEKSDALENKFDCAICRHPTVSEKNLRIHMSTVHRQKVIKVFRDPKKKEVSKKPLTSGSEDLRDSQVSENVIHKVEVEDDDNKSYFYSSDGNIRCKLCESVYTTLPGIIKHDRMHKESKLLESRYDCTICRHPNLSDAKLRRHLTKVHGLKQSKQKTFPTKKLNNPDVQQDSLILQPGTRRTVSQKVNAEGHQNVSEDEVADDDDSIDEEWVPLQDEEEKSIVATDSQINSSIENGLDELYHCDKCNIGYKSSRGLKRHEKEHQASLSLNHKHDCHCGFPASSERRLRYHKKRAHFENNHFTTYRSKEKNGRVRIRKKKANGKMQCKICKTKYWYLRSYKNHLDDHEKAKLIDNIWDCNICGYPCFSEKQLERHKTQQHERKILTCSICKKTFANHNLLKGHMRLHVEYDNAEDPETGLFRCKLCPFVGRNLRSLIGHKTAAHRDIALDSSVQYLLCPQCGKSFYTKGALRKHVKNIHENTYTYNCEECGKGFDSSSQFHYHKMVHDKSKRGSWVCDICGGKYSRQQTLIEHVEKYHSEQIDIPAVPVNVRRFPIPKDYRCKWCPSVFSFKYMLLNHMSSSHQDRYTFSCDQCDKKYTSGSSLRLHKEITHSDGKQAFTCKYCQKVFVHKQYVTCHYKCCAAKKAIEETKTNNSLSANIDEMS